jgi:hypothetical protein
MCSLYDYYKIALLRRKELTKIIFERTDGIVIDGPFKNMKVSKEHSWGDGDIANKLLGFYECELFPSFEDAMSKNPDAIVNIGCAEGFYGIGCALRLPNSDLYLLDINQDLLNISKINYELNNLINNVNFVINANNNDIEKILVKYKNPFVVMDCEGAEKDLCDPEITPSLKKSIVIVESHDIFVPNMIDILISRFQETHNITRISQGNKNAYIPLIKDFWDWDKMLLLSEGRGGTMEWLYMVPK